MISIIVGATAKQWLFMKEREDAVHKSGEQGLILLNKSPVKITNRPAIGHFRCFT